MTIGNLFGFKQAVDTVRGAPSVPRLVEWIEGSRVVHDAHSALVDGKPFTPGECYFALRLAGLHLQDARRFTTAVHPLCVCLAEFRRGGKVQSVPFSLGPDTVRQRLQASLLASGKDDGKVPLPGWVELHDVEVIPPTPVTLANLEVFVGLYAVPGDDVARILLNVMGSISQAFGGTLAPVLTIADKVYDGFNALLGVRGVTPVAEALHGNLLRNSGYLLVSSAPDNSQAKGKLFVSGGRLRSGQAPDSPPVTDFDYCLLAVQRRETVIEVQGRAPDLFEPQWQEVVAAFDGPEGAAATAFRRLQRAVYASPDLIARDRDALVAGYLLEYRKAVGVFGPEPAPSAVAISRASGLADVEHAVAGIGPLYLALTSEEGSELTAQDREALRSGASAWARAAQLRPALMGHEAGSVAEAILSAV